MKNGSKINRCNNPFPAALRRLMGGDDTLKKITQNELAVHLGVTRQTISQYMDGSTNPPIDKLIEISKFFNVSSDYLLGLTDLKSTNEDHKTVGKVTGLDDKSIQVLSNWNESRDNKLGYGSRDLKALNALLGETYDKMGKYPGRKIHSLFGEIGLYLYGDFEHITETTTDISPDVLSDPVFQLNSDTLFIAEKGIDNDRLAVAYDVNKVMRSFILENITEFIRCLKKEDE